MDSGLLATCDNYHLPRKNASYRFVILHGHPWGGRFQVSEIEGFFLKFLDDSPGNNRPDAFDRAA
jgi:hypothetical protein